MQTVEDKIRELKDLKLADYPREDIFRLIKSISASCPIMKVIIPRGKRLVRSRINEKGQRFSKKEELSFKRHEENTKYARASTPIIQCFMHVLPHQI